MARDDLLLTAEEVRLRNLRRRRLTLSILTAVVFVALAVVSVKPAARWIKGWQARRHAQKAVALIVEQKWEDAKNEVMAAYQLRQTEPQVIRALAQFLSRTRQPDALGFWQQLAKIDKLTAEDLRDEATIALIAGDAGTAESATNELLGQKEVGPAEWLLAAQLSIQKGAPDEALGYIDKVFADPRASEQQQFQTALLERSLGGNVTGMEDRVNDAWSRMQKLAQSKSEVGLNALVVLAQQILMLPKDAPHPFALTTEEILRGLESHPLAKAPQKLLALDLEGRVDPSRKPQLIDQAIARWKDTDPTELLALATWLNGKGEHEKMIDAMPLEKAIKTRELFLQYLDALGALAHWKDIKELLESERFPLDSVIQRMYLARCNAQLGEKAAEENNWQRALEAANSDAGKALLLADYAEKNGKIDIAEAAYAAAAKQAPRLRPAFQGKLRIAQSNRDTKKMHEILAEMLTIWPNDPSVQNDEAYTRLLLTGKPVEAAVSAAGSKSIAGDTPAATANELNQIATLASDLVQRNPRSLPHRTLLALALLKQNRPNDALQVYDNIQVAANALTPSALAVHAAVLAANGRKEDAHSEAGQLKPEQILPEERELVSDL